MEPAEQDRLAQPIYQDALEAETGGKLKRAAKLYKKVWENFAGSTLAPEAAYRFAKIEKRRKKWKSALAAYQRVVSFYPDSPYFNEVVADQFEIAAAFEEGDNVRFLWIFPARAFERAVGAYEMVVANAPYGEYAPIALMRIALIHRRQGDEVFAVDALDRLINNYPNSMLTGDAYLLLAETFADEVKGPEYDQGATREAMSYYRDFMILFPTNPAIEVAEDGLEDMREVFARSKLIMGEFFYNFRDDYTAAAVFFNEAITTAPESEAAAEARAYLETVDQIQSLYPRGDWPRRTAWNHLFFWQSWDPTGGRFNAPAGTIESLPTPAPELEQEQPLPGREEDAD